MIVMMPQVHCAEGSRVKNIKKQFEVLSNDPPKEAHVNGAFGLTYSSECEVSEKPPYNNLNSLLPSHHEVARISKSTGNLRTSGLKHEKCNIKRSPAFRCDRIVKGKNVSGQVREKPVSVEDKVKLFEDGKANRSDNLSTKEPRISERLNSTGMKDVCHENKDPVPIGGSLSSKTVSQLDNFGNKVARSNDVRYPLNVNAQALIHKTEVPARFSNKPLNSLSGDRMVSQKSMLNNGYHHAQGDMPSSNNQSGELCSLNLILSSPLPRGPPPRKPPRTFAHLSKPGANNPVPKPPHSIKSEAAVCVTPSTTSIPPLIRSKTESQIQLRSKLETALSKTPSSSLAPNRTSMVETKQHIKNRPIPVKPPTKPDLSPSSLLVGCLSLGCVNSNPYEEVGTQRKSNTRTGDRRESLDLRLSSSDVVEAKNNLVSLVRSHSEDHIYAVPFGDSKSPGKVNMRPQSLIHNNLDLRKNGNLETFKGATTSTPPEPNGLHYMCTPILNQGKLYSIDEDIPRADIGMRLTSPAFVNKVQKCSPHLTLSDFIKVPEESSFIDYKQNHSLVGQNFDGSPHSVTLESPLDDFKDSSLSHSVGKDGFNKGSKTSLCSPSTETEEENGEEDNDPMTKEMLEKRKGYVRRVCSMFQKMQLENSSYIHGVTATGYLSKMTQNPRTSLDPSSNQSVPSTAQPYQTQANPFPHLFECVLLVGLTLSSNQDQGKTYEPYIKSKFPPDVLVPPWIEHLCFPDATDWPAANALSSSKGNIADDLKKKDSKGDDEMTDSVCRGCTYSLVITGADGNRRFGYCRRVLPEGGSLCLPLNYCLISPFRANGFYFKVLAELESRHGLPEAEKTAFLQELYSCPLPGPGQIPCPSVSSSPSPPSAFLASLRRPFDTRLEERDVMELFCSLEVAVFLDLFASLLLERKVILTSSSLSKLSSCIEALQSVLYPFSWQHTFIPVLPAPMLDICHAPTPYIIGVLKGCNGQIPSITLDEGIMVDLDTSHCIQRVGDEGSILPARIKRVLQAALRLVTGLTPLPESNAGKNSSGSDGASPVRNVLVAEAFLRMFLMVVGHYPNHISVQQDGRKVFMRESFIKAMPFHGVQMFLEWFTETAMFSAFIHSRLEGRPESGDGIFEQRAHKFCEELEKDALLFLKNYKAITKKNKKFGDRLKDWASFS
ncbi:uncharacterized protein LOC124153845 [Ischnura elegans]|uniref:uncharacterized protein LOC124153845 n=1 Tax=Ischnura elegans TaxID=197161 RepID=UPI001ED8B930|nr:uncharacterized protein LOC124153845 [Ischnura elegans]